MRSLDHTQGRTTFGRTSLHEWSARRRDLYLTTHNTQTDIHDPRAGFKPTLSAGESPQTERPLGPAAKTHNLQKSTPSKNVSDLCKRGAPLKSRLCHWEACLRYYMNFLSPVPEKYRNIISNRTSRAPPLTLFPNQYILTMFVFDAVVYYFLLTTSLNKPQKIK
jgi:hypothetical protein